MCAQKEKWGLIDVQSWSVCDEVCGCDERLWHSTLALFYFVFPAIFFLTVGGLMKEK